MIMRSFLHSLFGPEALMEMFCHSFAAGSGVGAPSGAGPSAAPPAAAPSSAPPSASAPGAPSVPSGAPPASPSGQPSGQPSTVADPNAPNIEVLRQSHEFITRLGGREAAQAAVERVAVLNTLHTEGMELAQKLGFTPESFEKGFAQDPADVIAYLRLEASKPTSNTPPDLQQTLDARLAPLEHTLRLQAAERANTAVDGELNRVMSEHTIFKGKENIPADVKGFIQDLAREYLKYDTAGLQKVGKGDLSPVNAAFSTGLDRFFKAVNAFNSWQTQPATGSSNGSPNNPPNGNGNPPPANKWSLSDLIDGKEDAFQGLAITRR